MPRYSNCCGILNPDKVVFLLLPTLCLWLLLEFEIILFKIKGGDVAVVDFLFKLNDKNILISDFPIVFSVFKPA